MMENENKLAQIETILNEGKAITRHDVEGEVARAIMDVCTLIRNTSKDEIGSLHSNNLPQLIQSAAELFNAFR